MAEVDPEDLVDLLMIVHQDVNNVALYFVLALGASFLLNLITLGVALYALYRSRTWDEQLYLEHQESFPYERLPPLGSIPNRKPNRRLDISELD